MRQTSGHQSAGQKFQPPGYVFETADYDQLQLIYILGGELFFETDGATRRLTADTALLLREGGKFRLFTRAKGYHGVYYRCSDADQPAFCGPPVAFPGPAPMRALARLMQAEIHTPSMASQEILLGLGRALAWQAVRFSSRAQETSADDGRLCAERARAALDVAVYTGQGARQVLAGMELSYRQVSRHFQAAYGVSPKRYQLQARLREACELLRHTNTPVTTIAMELGFASSQHFATQFTAHHGVSPSAYRARQTKQKDSR
jgi:AraC-like DNA-binding protein